MFRHGLYVCIILETAHHRTSFRLFYNFTQKTLPEENSCKMFHFSSLIVLFLIGRSRKFFGDKDQFIWGGQKEGLRGDMGKKPKMRVIFAKFLLLKKIQTLSHKLLVRQTFYYHHCNWHAQKPPYKHFQVILSSSSSSKTTLLVCF